MAGRLVVGSTVHNSRPEPESLPLILNLWFKCNNNMKAAFTPLWRIIVKWENKRGISPVCFVLSVHVCRSLLAKCQWQAHNHDAWGQAYLHILLLFKCSLNTPGLRLDIRKHPGRISCLRFNGNTTLNKYKCTKVGSYKLQTRCEKIKKNANLGHQMGPFLILNPGFIAHIYLVKSP